MNLVSTAWLAERLDQPDIAVFDATYYLPGEGKDAASLFAAAHIPGAQFFDIDAVAEPGTSLPHMAPSARQFEATMRGFGVNDGTIAVFYDQKGIFSAARGWWLMRLFGHDRAAVLDGGLPRWREEGRAIETGAARPRPAGTFRARFAARRLRGLADMIENAASGAELVLDARPAARFAGTAPEPRPGLPSGHMPGAVSLPASTLLSPEGGLLPADALRRIFHERGVDGTRPVVTSCGSGVTAAILTLGLSVAGLPEGALYDGSWAEWGAQPDTPKLPA